MGSFRHPKDLDHENLKMKSVLTGDFPQFVGRAPAGAADTDKIWQLSEETWNATSGVKTTQVYAQDNAGIESNDFKYSWVATKSVEEIKIQGGVIAGNTLTVDIDGTTVTQAFSIDKATTVAAWAVSIAAENPVAQIQTLTTDAALIAVNDYETTIDGGTPISTTFATSNDATLTAHAAAIAGEAGVGTAVVTPVGGDATDDREIVITAAVAGTPVVITAFSIQNGASQAGVVNAITTANGSGVETAVVRAPGNEVIIVTAQTGVTALVVANGDITGTQINGKVTVVEKVPHQLAPASMTYGT